MARSNTNDVEVNEHNGLPGLADGPLVEILVFNGEVNGAYLTPEEAIEVALDIIEVSRALIRKRGRIIHVESHST